VELSDHKSHWQALQISLPTNPNFEEASQCRKIKFIQSEMKTLSPTRRKAKTLIWIGEINSEKFWGRYSRNEGQFLYPSNIMARFSNQ
jgi:hypothetical protein